MLYFIILANINKMDKKLAKKFINLFLKHSETDI